MIHNEDLFYYTLQKVQHLEMTDHASWLNFVIGFIDMLSCAVNCYLLMKHILLVME